MTPHTPSAGLGIDAGGRAGPFTVGADVAGVVEAVSDGVTRFAAGDRVLGMPRFPHEAGAYAEFVAAPSRHLACSPSVMPRSHLRDPGRPRHPGRLER